ncbi:MAG: hypothetical protein IPG60_14945 [Bacteroidetes bacterium]|nr:hypothetical protein [Bacteroidota bacterium]MBP7399419.1 hypothetical protein [Chitinophagales bacterium]MBK7110087.1 hypothetical protein [Bacteroidota bacterium]MBK8487187.1 hypothetical protein [Bacteroidota bacterium]MBK8680573.1 hypothetical protein [Bacteroidota bacterium]
MQLILTLFFSLHLFGFNISNAEYIKEGEHLILSFKTTEGKVVSLSTEENNTYIIFRYGTKHNINLEFPANDSMSWKQISYSYYLRGGGVANEGLDLNYVYFESDSLQYVLYDNFYAHSNSQSTGIKIINLRTSAITDMPAKQKSKKGNLLQLRDNAFIHQGETIFD